MIDWDDVTEPRFAFLPKRAGAALERAPQPRASARAAAPAPRVLGMAVARPLPSPTDGVQAQHLRRVHAARLAPRTMGRARSLKRR